MIPGAGGGSVFGGWLVHKFNLSCQAILRLQVVLTALTCFCILGFLIWCDSIPIPGVTVPYSTRSVFFHLCVSFKTVNKINS